MKRLNYVTYLEYSRSMGYLMIYQRKNKFIVARNHEYKEMDSINSVSRP